MSELHYRRTVSQLREYASMFWPRELSQKEENLSIIPKLIETQEQFITILSIEIDNIEQLFKIIEASNLFGNLFLKHLVVLSDFGGEKLQRVNSQFNILFPDRNLNYIWRNQPYIYTFKCLPIRGRLSNSKLGIDGKKLLEEQSVSGLHQDVIALLLFGSGSTNRMTAETLYNCEVGNYIGHPEQLKKFIQQRYIWVSRITTGAKSNHLGQLAQNFVKEYLESKLTISEFEIERDSTLPNVTHTDENSDRLTTFDLVVSKNDRFVAIEISFQVTTNSVIERKAGQARSRFEQIEKEGYKIAYVLDGAGNFERESALRTLCSYSHCTVALSVRELDVLCDFIQEYLG